MPGSADESWTLLGDDLLPFESMERFLAVLTNDGPNVSPIGWSDKWSRGQLKSTDSCKLTRPACTYTTEEGKIDMERGQHVRKTSEYSGRGKGKVIETSGEEVIVRWEDGSESRESVYTVKRW